MSHTNSLTIFLLTHPLSAYPTLSLNPHPLLLPTHLSITSIVLINHQQIIPLPFTNPSKKVQLTSAPRFLPFPSASVPSLPPLFATIPVQVAPPRITAFRLPMTLTPACTVIFTSRCPLAWGAGARRSRTRDWIWRPWVEGVEGRWIVLQWPIIRVEASIVMIWGCCCGCWRCW